MFLDYAGIPAGGREGYTDMLRLFRVHAELALGTGSQLVPTYRFEITPVRETLDFGTISLSGDHARQLGDLWRPAH